MLTNLFGLANLILIAASFLTLWLREVHRKFSLVILQVLFFLPLLVVEYLAVALNFIPDSEGFTILLVSQNLFLVIWSTAAYRLLGAMSASLPPSTSSLRLIYAPIVVLVLVITIIQILVPSFEINPEGINFSSFGLIYFASLMSLLVMLFMAWQLEAFWRQLPKSRRRQYGLFVVGSILVCVVQGGVASYRLTFLELRDFILFLQAVFLLISWLLLLSAVLRHRLLNRNLFISRKIVYSLVAPSIFAAYFLTLGIISLVMRFTGYPLEWVLFWFLTGIGAVAVAILAVSEPIRQHLRFFISTHFYVNKYEYRDEWLAFSALLQEAHSEVKVLEALGQVLAESLYTKEIWIWAGSLAEGFRRVISPVPSKREFDLLAVNDPIVLYLQKHSYLDLNQMKGEGIEAIKSRLESWPPPSPVLLVPLNAGRQLVGCIGLGQEYTGGRYGQDDFDLLAALGSQAASALLAVRLAEETARWREHQAVDNLSVFLVHDIKNTASILSLIHTNAQTHMENPEFRKDMLIAIDDALKRMKKVQSRLDLLRDKVEPVLKDLDPDIFLDSLLPRFKRQLPGLDIVLDCSKGIMLRTDPQLLETVIENLILNAYEACDGKGKVQLSVFPDNAMLTITVTDDGPSIPGHLLPDQLFQPFVSDKPGGTGIGLWQVGLVLRHLGATITAENPATGGARFVIHLPLADFSLGPVDPAS